MMPMVAKLSRNDGSYLLMSSPIDFEILTYAEKDFEEYVDNGSISRKKALTCPPFVAESTVSIGSTKFSILFASGKR